MGCDLVLFGEMTQPIMGILLQIMVGGFGGVFMFFWGVHHPMFFQATLPRLKTTPTRRPNINLL